MGSFVNSSMLWFALAGAIPIIIHLLNRQKYRRIKWAAMEFLLRAVQKTRRRLQLENLLLLALRVGILVLLAAALAQPVLKQTALSALIARDTHFVLVLDNSYSMGYQKSGQRTPFDRAKSAAGAILNQIDIAKGDKVSLVLLSDAPTLLMADPSVQVDLAKKRIAELALSDRGTRVTQVFPVLSELLEKSTLTRRKVVLLTDLARIGWTVEEQEKQALRDALTKIASLPDTTFHVVDVGSGDRRNLAVKSISTPAKIIGTDTSIEFAAEIHNFGEEEAATSVTFFVDNAKQETAPISVPPGQARPAPFSFKFHEAGPHVVTAELDPDALPADNRRSLAVDAHVTLRVLLVDGEPSPDNERYQDEAIFVRLALNPTTDTDALERASIFAVDTVTPISFPSTPVKNFDLVILTNLEMIYEDKLAELETYVKSGGGLLVFLGDRVSKSGYNELLWKKGEGLLPAELGDPSGDKTHGHAVRLEKPTLNHPALSFFTDARARPLLANLPVYEYYATTPDETRPEVKVLARYTDSAGSPALIERRFGRGKVILCTTTADYEWTDMIKEQGYVILVDQLAQYLSSQPQTFKNVQVGEALEHFLHLNEYARIFNLTTPRRGVTALLPAQVGEGFYLSYKGTEDAGVYVLEKPGDEGAKTELISYFTVNVDPGEGDLAPINEEELRQRFPELKFQLQRDQTGQPGEALEVKSPPSRMWKYLAYLVVAFAVAEMILAMHFGRKK
ncbi:MAG: BatA domain-containing protein [Planctomycetes bacterium]|nr:BatA domain-containing protein [Planctomycetota bacterium]